MTSVNRRYYGCVPACLDIFTLTYRWFGAVWRYEDEHQVVDQFWFGDTREQIEQDARDAGFSLDESQSPDRVLSIYQHMRKHQREQDWNNCSRMPLWTAFFQPWKDVRRGWYVICSRGAYPCYAVVIVRGKFVVRMEHICLCESELELDDFLEQVKQRHSIAIHCLLTEDGSNRIFFREH